MLLKRIRDLREDRDMTQSDVAMELRIAQNTYSNYESGERSIPIHALMRLAALHDTSVDYLLGMTDHKQPYPRSRYWASNLEEKGCDERG